MIKISRLTISERQVQDRDSSGHPVSYTQMMLTVDYEDIDVATGKLLDCQVRDIIVDDPEVYTSGEDLMQWAVDKINDSYKAAAKCFKKAAGKDW